MKTCLTLLCLCLSLSFTAQNETIYWYFGNRAALNFDKGKIEVLGNSAMEAPAGSTSIANEDGLLMFYSDGASVWNRKHEIMENGSGLAGDPNNFQSAIIVPKPGTNNNYYLFYARSENSTNPLVTAGSFYSEIEFSNDFPLGKVISKNGFLDSNAPSEKLTAVHHKSGESFWLLILTAANSDPEELKTVFKAYPITDAGINFNAKITNLDVGIEQLGTMKFSTDGKKLIVASQTTSQNTRYVHYFDFNNETGEITFNRNLLIDPPGATWPPKGIEISPNGQFVYISFDAGNNNGVFQYEIEGPGTQDDARAILYFRPNIKVESLQLANDQKIYVALSFENDDSGILGVINEPNEKSLLANYTPLIPELNPGSSKRGLPNFIQSYFASKIFTENQCYVDTFSFSSTSYATISETVWDFGDGNFGTGISTTHTYSAPGEYIVKGVLTVGSKKVTVYKVVEAYALPVLNPNQELIECDEDSDGRSTFNLFSITPKITNPSLNEDLFFYLSQSDLDNNIPISNPENFQNTLQNQEVFVKAVNENGCFESTSFIITARFVDLANIENFYVCEDSDGVVGDTKGLFESDFLAASIRNQLSIPTSTLLSFYPTYLDAQTNLNEFETNFTSTSGTIYVKAQEADFSCGGIQGFNIIVNATPPINLQDSYTICFDPSVKPPVVVSASTINNLFEWKNANGDVINTSQNFELNQVGQFSLTVYKSENGILCSNTKNFEVVNPPIPSFGDIIVNTEDEKNNTITVNINGNSSYEFSLNNIDFFGDANNYFFSNVDAGLQTIYVRDTNTCEQSIQINVSVIGFKKYFTPNGDGENDFWNVKGLDKTSFKSIDVQIFDRFGKLIYSITNFDTLGWNGSYNGKNLNANNFWFKAKIVDKDDNEIKESGNFSLIRD